MRTSYHSPAFATALLALTLPLVAAPAIAQPPGGDAGSIEDAFAAADMTFTTSEADGITTWDLKSPDGYTFKLSELEDGEGFDFDMEHVDVLTPNSGVWRVELTTTGVSCPGHLPLEAVVPQLLESGRRLTAIMLSSPDMGRSVPYEFSDPFDLGQLFDPVAEVLADSGQSVAVDYAPANRNVHGFQGAITGDDFVTSFKGEVGIISPDLLMGWFTASNEMCSVQAALTYWRNAD